MRTILTRMGICLSGNCSAYTRVASWPKWVPCQVQRKRPSFFHSSGFFLLQLPPELVGVCQLLSSSLAPVFPSIPYQQCCCLFTVVLICISLIIRGIKGTFHVKMGLIKDRNGMELTEAEDIKKRWQEYTELYKKDLLDPDNHNGAITHLKPDILGCKVKWTLISITMNKPT